MGILTTPTASNLPSVVVLATKPQLFTQPYQGGNANRAKGIQSSVGGGRLNQATAINSTVAGGYENKATGTGSTIAGGSENKATGTWSTIAGGSKNQATGTGSFAAGVENKANTDNAVAVGKKNIINGDNSAAIGSNNTVENDKKDVFIFGSNTKNAQSGSVLLGNKTSGKQATAVSDATVGNLNLTGFAGASKSENGVVSVGSEGGERQIVNVGAGQISANSTDAVNGSQLHALATAVSQNQDNILTNRVNIKELERKQENDIKDVVKMQNAIAEQADKNRNHIQDLAKAQLAGVTVMEELNKNVEKNRADADASFETLTKNQNALIEQDEAQDALIAQNQTNITANKNTIEQNVNRTVANGFEIEKNKAGIAKNQADIAANKADADANFETLTKNQNALIEQDEAINQELEGFAAHADVQDQNILQNQADIAANKADADANFETLTKNQNALIEQDEAQDALIAQNQTDITANKTAIEQNVNRTVANGFEIEKNKAGIATNKQELIIQNNRLNRIDETNNRQDQKIDQLGYTLKEQGQYFNSRISAVERQTAGGIANAIAIATLPSPNRAGEHHVLFGSGYHNGQAAVSLGAAGSSDTGKSTYKIGLSWSDAGGLSGGVGGSYRWK
ncbi:YadA-like family protein [Moraxella catarrhalis]|uniref:YadA-like family protein n=1 Tax=Moraxella catarrhalis TaxID=480 RepID=UPI00217D7E6A|nr:YadA-like family protein [Moraxella catarrhalis]